MTSPVKNLIALFSASLFGVLPSALAREESLRSPDGRVRITVSDTGGLHYRVEVDKAPVLVESRLGLALASTGPLGSSAQILAAERTAHDGSWENRFGQRRRVPDTYRELQVSLREQVGAKWHLRLIVRAYDNGVAFRYELPDQPGLRNYIVTDEFTEFRFPSDLPCWAGNFNSSAECQYPAKKLSQLSAPETPPQVLPLLVHGPATYVAIAESDLLDWAGMFLSRAPEASGDKHRPGAKVTLAERHDGRGKVVGRERRLSPWRVLMLAHKAADLLTNDLVATLATPSRLQDSSWVKPGISAWDAWWTGVNPSQPEHTGVYSRGDTRSHREYIDFAAHMGFPYQVMDWFWYEHMTSWDKGLNSTPNSPSGDFSRPLPSVDIPALVAHARERGVNLWLWAHSLDIKAYGMERALTQLAGLGVVGIKVDFFSSDSQETVQWVQQLLECAARHRLLVDLHGIYKPTGLSRTYPNLLTQEGVLGNEYKKLTPDACTPAHEVMLPFTRALLGPMDFTPGGFLNRTKKDFKVTAPAEVTGTRARQLAMAVIYPSPLLVLCDSPSNYLNQPGLDFFRGLPTVWDDSLALSAEVGGHVVLARRCEGRWYLAAMNGDDHLKIKVPLSFLGKGTWTLRAFADTANSLTQPTSITDTTCKITSSDTIELTLAPAGGYAAILTPLE